MRKSKEQCIIFYKGYRNKDQVRKWCRKNKFDCKKIIKEDKEYKIILRKKRYFKKLLMPQYKCKEGVKIIKGYTKWVIETN